jgi:hypothetical protein
LAYSAGQVVSEYRLSLTKLAGDIAAAQRQLATIKPPPIATPTVDNAAAQQAAQLARLNAQLAAEQARAQAQVTQATTQASLGQQRLAVAQNATAVSAQRLAQAEQQTAQAMARTARETATTAAAQARAEAAQLRLAASAQRQAAAQERLAAGGRSWTSTISETAGKVDGFIGTVAGLGGAFAAVQVAQAGLDFARTGASIDAARQSFDNLASSAGTSGAALLKSLNDAAAGTVANTDLIKSSNTALLLLGSDVASQLPQLLAVAKASAQTLGTDVGQVFDSLVTGISRGSTELIDNAGITLKAGDAYAAYAATIGKSADALSAAEKQQALLNGVLTAGQTIVEQTAGGGEATAASYQRFDAAAKNLTATLQVAAATGFAPAVNWLGQITQAAANGIGQLTNYGAQIDQLNGRILGGTGGYEAYAAQVAATNEQIRAGYGVFGFLAGQIEALTPQAYAFRDSLIAQGVAAGEADARATTYNGTLMAIGQTAQLAGRAFGDQATAYAAVAAQSAALLQSNAGLEPQIRAIIDALNNNSISAAEAQAQIAALAAAQDTAALAIQNVATSDIARAGAAAAAAAATREGADAANANALASLEQAAAAELTAQRHDELDQAIRAAADAGGDAEAAAARLAGQFNGVETPAVLNLIRLHRELAAARAGAAQAANVSAALTDARAGERNPANDPSRAAFLERMAANKLKYEQEQARIAARTAGRAGGGGGGAGGGGAKTPAVKAAEKQATELSRLDEQRLQLAQDTQERLQELEVSHGEKLLDIQRQYAEKQLQAERGLRTSSLNSRADFYDALTQSSPEIGQAAADGLAAAYEGAFAKAQEFAQSGQAALGASFLQLRQQQIQAELSYQQSLAQAKEKGDGAEVARLQQIEALRAAAREEELKQLLEGGDANVAAKDDALTTEQARFAEQTGQITGASADKATKLAADEAKIRGEVVQTNAALAEQLRLQQAAGGARTAGAGLPAATAPAAAPAAPVGAGLTATATGAPVLIDAPALAAQIATLDATVARIAGVVEGQQGLLAAIAGATADTARKVSATRSGG